MTVKQISEINRELSDDELAAVAAGGKVQLPQLEISISEPKTVGDMYQMATAIGTILGAISHHM